MVASLVNARSREICLALMLGLMATHASMPVSADDHFPYDRELLLDSKPMRGSKRIPSLQISANGLALIELWCNSGRGQVVIAAETITIIPGSMSERQCGRGRKTLAHEGGGRESELAQSA